MSADRQGGSANRMFATANAAGPQGVDTTSTTEGVGSSPIISSTKDIYTILRLLMLKSVRPEALIDNPFKMIGKDWMLVTACTRKIDEDGNVINGRANTMTASWGGVGILWNKPVATIYLRPTRYTKEIIDQTDEFSLTVLPEKYRNALNYCGSHSGRDEDKFRAAKLTLDFMNDVPWVKEGRVVLFCRKLYAQEMDPNSFTDEKICNQNYRKNDFHTMYIAEITKVLMETRDTK